MLKRLLLSLVLIFSFFAGTLVTRSPSLAQSNPSEETIACIGKSLAAYMNAVIKGVNTNGLSSKIKLLSPAFNMTSGFEPGIYTSMVANGANFAGLWGFAGNVYTIDGKNAYQWYIDNGWEAAAGGKPVVFTEFGDFGARPGVIPAMTAEFTSTAARANVAGIAYFNGLNTNTDWALHALSPQQLSEITRANPSKGGVNSARPVDGNFPNVVEAAVGDLGWTVEIISGDGDLSAASASVRAAHAAGLRPVLRLCVGNTCGFSDPEVLISFLTKLAASVDGEVYVIAGPNEPASEGWASQNCQNIVPERPYDYLPRIACGLTRDDEFHSLRPYPTNPCNPAVDQATYLCSNDMVTRESFEVTPTSSGVTGCTGDPATGQTCNYRFTSSVAQIANFSDTELPIAGNTQLVPNVKGPQNLLTFAQRMNEYVSWYLNGTTYRAEEDLYDTLTESQVIEQVVNFSGPLKKLLPIFIQQDRREDQRANIGTVRHNQIVVCTLMDLLNPFDRLSCYNSGFPEDRLRISEVEKGTPVFNLPHPLHKFIPFSSTEDLMGEAKVVPGARPAILEIDGVKTEVTSFVEDIPAGAEVAYTRDKLYYPHMEENTELIELLQSTYKPADIGDHGGPEPEVNLDQTPYCELVETRTNPGDDLYGEFDFHNNVPTNTNLNPVKVTIGYTTTFTCDFPPVVPPVDPVTGLPIIDPVTGLPRPAPEPPHCRKNAFVTTKLVNSVPLVDDLWERTVNGTQSVFKRMFPRIGKNTPVVEIDDIPAKSIASYSSQEISATGDISALAGNPGSSRSGGNAQVFFPHLGSVKDYFLEGIQKALRPQSDDVESGENGSNVGSSDNSMACTAAFMSIFGAEAEKALCIAKAESRNCTSIVNKNCLTIGGSQDYSIGIFQINLLAHPAFSNIVPVKLRNMWNASGVPSNQWSCKHAFQPVGGGGGGTIGQTVGGRMTVACKPGTLDWQVKMLQDCETFFSDPVNSREYAKAFVDHPTGDWAYWSTNSLCSN
jgi:hypothetical protein